MSDTKAALIIDIETMPGFANVNIVKLASGGDRAVLIEAIAIAMVGSAKLRGIINEAGSMANKIRRGEMPQPGNWKFNASDN